MLSQIQTTAWQKLDDLFSQMEFKIASQMNEIEPILEAQVFTGKFEYEDAQPYIQRSDIKDFIEKIKFGINENDLKMVEAGFEELIEACEVADIDILEIDYYVIDSSSKFVNFYDDVMELIEIIKVEEGILIYSSPKIEIIKPEIILATSDSLLSTLCNNPRIMYEISPRKFEELIADIFFRNGFIVELTKQTRDGGRDIIAFSDRMNIRTKYIVECKRYAENRKISLATVQRLYGVTLSDKAHMGILATTSAYTKEAKSFGDLHMSHLSLKDYHDVVEWVRTCPKISGE